MEDSTVCLMMVTSLTAERCALSQALSLEYRGESDEGKGRRSDADPSDCVMELV